MRLIPMPPDVKSPKCRLCFSDAVKLIFRVKHNNNSYTVIVCQNCEVIQTLEHYDEVSPDYVNLSDEKVDENRLWCQGEHKIPAFRQWWTQAQSLMINKKTNLRLLDIGCGTGGFLRYARSIGFEVHGFDASLAQARYAQQELPHICQASSISDYLMSLEKPEIEFDIITLWDVLEHIRDPLEFLLSVRNSLKAGGLLYLSVPNGKAMLWKRRLYGMLGRNHDQEWIPWEHVFYFSIKSLRLHLKKLGFEVLQTGAVDCYPRPVSVFEVVRRTGFLIFSWFPSRAPQIYVWACKAAGNSAMINHGLTFPRAT